MKWTKAPAEKNQPEGGDWESQEANFASALPPPPSQPGAQSQSVFVAGKLPEIRVGKRFVLSTAERKAANMEVFTLTMGEEAIELLPFKNWGQLDHYKWTARGKLPAEPSGLEVGPDYVRIAGETVPLNDPAGCAKLERLFNDWLLFQRETLELARQKKVSPQPLSPAAKPSDQPGSQRPHFCVEVDKRGQVHIHCVEGKATLASIGLTVAGFNSLYQQGLIRKPHTLETGALHDWVELDGELYSFEKGRNDAARLEQSLNERYVPMAAVGHAKEVVILLSAASSTGFDIQFPVLVGRVPEIHRYHLNEQSLELLQDPDHCGLLHRNIIVKLIPPNLVFKQKTPDGGEQYLAWSPENTVTLTEDEGQQVTIRLSQPLNLLRLSAAELTAVFNHPVINRHGKAMTPAPSVSEPPTAPAGPGPLPPAQSGPSPPTSARLKRETLFEVPEAQPPPAAAKPLTPAPENAPKPAVAEPGFKPRALARPLPNVWLKEVLSQPALQHDWFACLAYRKMAERFGNSSEGKFGPGTCWFISLGESADIGDPAFKGVFLTEKGSLGFLNQEQMARFYNGIAFLGTQKSALEGIEVSLVAVGLDAQQRVVFLLSDNYRGQFGVTEAILIKVLNRLGESGAVIMSIREALASPEPLEVVWTVPANQPDPNDPQALESTRAPA